MNLNLAKFFLRSYTPIMSQVNNLFTQSPKFTYVRNEDNTPEAFPIPKRWVERNLLMYQPQSPDEPRRRAVYYYVKPHVRTAPKKMWYICSFVKGMSIDEAYKQLAFIHKKSARLMEDALREAQGKILAEGIIEFKSNMWIGECYAIRGVILKGIRKRARRAPGVIRCFHSHLFLALVEGPPEKNFFIPSPMSNKEKLEAYIERLRLRRIDHTI